MSATVWTDGACHPNPGFGGWAFVMERSGRSGLIERSGHAFETTNNAMELTAVIRALESLPKGEEVTLFVDSQYVMFPFTKGWINGWRRSHFNGRPNALLWEQLDRLVPLFYVRWNWIRGHQDNVNHNRADELAVAARLALRAEMEAEGADW